MKRIVNGKEVMIICLNSECHYWDDTCLFGCDKYESTNEVMDCPDASFKPGFYGPVEL